MVLMGIHYLNFFGCKRKPESGTEERPDVNEVCDKAEEGAPLARLRFACCMLGFK